MPIICVNGKMKKDTLRSSVKKEVILEFLSETTDKDILNKKRVLTYNVPYRLQAPFLPGVKGKSWDIPVSALADRINEGERLIYYFNRINGLDTKITIQDDWAEYIRKNYEILLGWVGYNMIRYLQRRNPNVPGIADKLSPPMERNLDKVKKYWKLILSLEPVHEIYGDQLLTSKDISVDHFVPWSYVAHDEFWNLSPTTRSINSSKSNNLPDWDIYFKKLVTIEYQSYRLIWQYDEVHKEFEKCAKEHINNDEIRERIYREGLSLAEFADGLESVVSPVYKAARDCGFTNWEYRGITV